MKETRKYLISKDFCYYVFIGRSFSLISNIQLMVTRIELTKNENSIKTPNPKLICRKFRFVEVNDFS